MIFLPNGKIRFDNIYELYYNLFMEIGLGINDQQYLYDQDTQTCIMFKDKYIKATVQPVPIYAGKNDIIFDPSENFQLMSNLFGYFLDKFSSDEDNEIKYIAHSIEDNDDKSKQRIVIRTSIGDIKTDYYYCLYLGFIEAIFILNQNINPDLSNFDINRFIK